jgi:hypothetical protein
MFISFSIYIINFVPRNYFSFEIETNSLITSITRMHLTVLVFPEEQRAVLRVSAS